MLRVEPGGIETLQLESLDRTHLDAVFHAAGRGPARGAILQVHGINADMDEGGMFVRLAEGLADAGFDVLRFSFRGHGRSGGAQRGVTIAGECLDVQAAIDSLQARSEAPVAIVAASFGAVSTCVLLSYYEARMRALVLWNPVLDLRGTFIDPELPWGKENFTDQARRRLADEGALLLDGEFEIGRALYEEMIIYDPLDRFVRSQVPAAIVHGNRDTAVSYEVSLTASRSREHCELITIGGAEHGFDPDKEDEGIQATIAWLDRRYARP
jgi:alpha-beta hydrolase superfamily lysophospholipase